ncbi:MAG: sulfatase [Planctomycetia bacterium]|nr:sulfatase [Planctomycetia bacterium]
MKKNYSVLFCLLWIFASNAICEDTASRPADATYSADAMRPNVVFVLVDDLGACDLGYSGSLLHETPNIDSLAQKGTIFTNGYAACAVCSPTRAALQTGKSPARLGLTDWIRSRFQGGAPQALENGAWPYSAPSANQLACPANPIWLEREEVTLAERLRSLGYMTAYVGKWHLGPEGFFPEDQGYDYNVGGCDLGQPPSYFDPYYPDSTESEAGSPNLRPLYRITTLKPEKRGEFLTNREAREAAGLIRKAVQEKRPFFLQVSHYAVHTPIMSRSPVREKYKARLEEMRKTNPNLKKNFNQGRDDRDPNQVVNEQRNPNYAGLVESVDDAMGVILDTLRETGILENTIVVFTSDNGGFCGVTDNFPLRDGKGTPYEGGLRVPLIVYLPESLRKEGVEVPQVCDIPCSTCDWTPTLLRLVGAPIPPSQLEAEGLDGRDVAPALLGEELDDTPLFWHFPHYRLEWEPYSVVRDGEWKLIRFYTTAGYRNELYNLSNDPQERVNLAEEAPETTRRLSALLDEWLQKTGARLPRK